MTRLVVVGGGVAGLAAAWEAATGPHPFDEVVVLEGAERLGGKLRTTDVALPDGTSLRIDEGADAFLARRPEATILCHEVGLADELTSPAVGRAKVLVDGELRFLPTTTVLGVPTDLDDPDLHAVLGDDGLAELRTAVAAADGASPVTEDTAIGPFLRSRLGPTTVARIVAPLVGGINAGDVDRLSLTSVTPQLAVGAADGGPLGPALAARAVADDPRPVFQAPRSGMSRLPERLAEQLAERGVALRTGATVVRLRSTDAGVEVTYRRTAPDTPDPTEEAVVADGVVVATPGTAAAGLLHGVSEAAAAVLVTVEHASVALVTVVVDRDSVTVPLDASGVLVPRGAGTAITAVSWGSVKWAHWDDGRHVVLRASVGHDGDDRGRDLEDDTLVGLVLDDLRTVMGLTAAPLAVRVSRWVDGFAQYRPGHADLVASVRAALLADEPRVQVAGATYDGVGVPASIGTGRRAAAALGAAVAASSDDVR